MSSTDRVRSALEAWANTVYAKAAAKPGALRANTFRTSSGTDLAALYGPPSAPPESYEAQLGLPGAFPFTRGVQPTMYRGRFWTMRQYAGFGTAEQTNARFHYLLGGGQTGLSTAFDLPTQMGHDSDAPRAKGEVGRVGVAIDSIEDLGRLFKGIPLAKVSTSMTINATGATLLALYQAVGEAQGARPDELSGTIQNDVLKEYIARGTYIYPPAPSMRLITDTFEYCAKVIPKFNPISISGYHIREAGSTAAQEIAFTLGDGIAYVEAAVKKGLDVDAFAGRLSFFFNVHNHFLEEVAKFRAARRMWAKIMRDRFHAKDPKSWMLRFHAQTAGSTLTAQQPDNNVVRVALQAFAAVLGGAQSLHTNGRDEALSLPTEASARIALRTQQIIAYESGVCDLIDPLGGAYALEALTDDLEAKASALIEKIDGMGGMVEAIAQEFPQREIEDAAFTYQREIEEKKRTIVGVNDFVVQGEPPFDTMKVDPALEEEQVVRVRAFRAARDQAATTRTLDALARAAEGQENLMPFIVDAVKAKATLGEVANTLRKVFGEHGH
ncbi:MAG: methylmalonyl-CoA mutase [Deltaproteobacteria bacterium]|nr:methylmalonyl-CoA mutase [Deltaproteobacteria bacterium]